MSLVGTPGRRAIRFITGLVASVPVLCAPGWAYAFEKPIEKGGSAVSLRAVDLASLEGFTLPETTQAASVVTGADTCPLVLGPVVEKAGRKTRTGAIVRDHCGALFRIGKTGAKILANYPNKPDNTPDKDEIELVLVESTDLGTLEILPGEDVELEVPGLDASVTKPVAWRVGDDGTWYSGTRTGGRLQATGEMAKLVLAQWKKAGTSKKLQVRMEFGEGEVSWEVAQRAAPATPTLPPVQEAAVRFAPGDVTLSTTRMLDLRLLVASTGKPPAEGYKATLDVNGTKCEARIADGATTALAATSQCGGVTDLIAKDPEQLVTVRVAGCQKKASKDPFACDDPTQAVTMTLRAVAPHTQDAQVIDGKLTGFASLEASQGAAFRVGATDWHLADIEPGGRLVARTPQGALVWDAWLDGRSPQGSAQVRTGALPGEEIELAVVPPVIGTYVPASLSYLPSGIRVDNSAFAWSVRAVDLAEAQYLEIEAAAGKKVRVSVGGKSCEATVPPGDAAVRFHRPLGAPPNAATCAPLFGWTEKAVTIAVGGKPTAVLALRKPDATFTRSVHPPKRKRRSPVPPPNPRDLFPERTPPASVFLLTDDGWIPEAGSGFLSEWFGTSRGDEPLVIRYRDGNREIEEAITLDRVPSWCRAEPRVPDDWALREGQLFTVCYEASAAGVEALLPTGVPYLFPNQPIAIVVRSKDNVNVDVAVGGKPGLHVPEVQKGDESSRDFPKNGQEQAQGPAPEGSGVRVGTWYAAPRLPDDVVPVTVTTKGASNADGAKVVSELTVRPVYTNAIRVGLATAWVPANDAYSTYVVDGRNVIERQADTFVPEFVVGYASTMSRRPRENVVPRIAPMPWHSLDRWSSYVGLGVVSLERADQLEEGYLTSLYGGLEYEIWPSATVALTGVVRRGQGLRDPYMAGDVLASSPTNFTKPVFRPGVALVFNMSPSFFRYAQTFPGSLKEEEPSTPTAEPQTDGDT